MIKTMEKILKFHSEEIILSPFNKRRDLIFRLIDKYAVRKISPETKVVIEKSIISQLGIY